MPTHSHQRERREICNSQPERQLDCNAEEDDGKWVGEAKKARASEGDRERAPLIARAVAAVSVVVIITVVVGFYVVLLVFYFIAPNSPSLLQGFILALSLTSTFPLFGKGGYS